MFVLPVVLVVLGGAPQLHLSPSIVELRGQFGQNTTQTLRLRNDTAVPLDFTLEARDVVVRGGARTFVEAGSIPGSIAATAVFSRRTVTVAPGATGAVDVTLTLVPGARHRAVVVFFRGLTRLGPGGTMRASLGALLTFDASTPHRLVAAPPLVSPPTAFANALLEQPLINDGGEPVVAQGAAVLVDGRGQVVGRAAFEPRRLLPGERLAVRAEFQGDLPPGRYRVAATFDYADTPLQTTAELIVP